VANGKASHCVRSIELVTLSLIRFDTQGGNIRLLACCAPRDIKETSMNADTRRPDVPVRMPLLLLGSLTLVVAAVFVVPSSAAANKPANLIVLAGAKSMTWSYPLPVATGVVQGTIGFVNAKKIAQVRAIVNALPVQKLDGRTCPFFIAPYPPVLTFARSSEAAPFAKVVFTLGGCPYAQVFQGRVAIVSILGDKALQKTYDRIVKILSPQGPPLG
jgi:hypothetical protein